MTKRKDGPGRSGSLIAINDDLIYDILSNPLFEIRPDGTVWSLIQRTGKVGTSWRECGTSSRNKDKPYVEIHYHHHKIRRSRLVFAKYGRCPLSPDLIVAHKNANSMDDHPDNLELITQSESVKRSFRARDKNKKQS